MVRECPQRTPTLRPEAQEPFLGDFPEALVVRTIQREIVALAHRKRKGEGIAKTFGIA
jgi:hypothetical protein